MIGEIEIKELGHSVHFAIKVNKWASSSRWSEVKTTYVRNNSLLYADGNNVEERDKSMMLGERGELLEELT